MAPAGQGQAWSHVLCCLKCDRRFSSDDLPVNLACGHVICKTCIPSHPPACPMDETKGSTPWDEYPINVPLLSICVEDYQEELPPWDLGDNKELTTLFFSIEKDLLRLSAFLKKAESERGGSVFSETLSRTMQRKLVSLICFQLVEDEGRSRALKTCRALVDRIVAEIIAINSTSNPSTQLWSEVRARGCQFLGPAMQEDVLKLILLALGNGAQIARKTLVIYVVQQMDHDYPQVSKTCVGHVVQLLYRASCFHVIKREGESSLMQLKEEFRNYETLRKEHDAQIVQMAMEAGLRISPDQWSSLLYGDFTHRSHMQSIIDKLQLPYSYQLSLEEIETYANQGEPLLHELLKYLTVFRDVHPFHIEHVPWKQFSEAVYSLAYAVELHVTYIRKKNDIKQKQRAWRAPKKDDKSSVFVTTRYKTKMCRDITSGQTCPRGTRCTYAHSNRELQTGLLETPQACPITQPMAQIQLNCSPPQGKHLEPPPQIVNNACEQQYHHRQQNNMGPVNTVERPMMQRVQLIHAPNHFSPMPQHIMPQPLPEVVPMMPMVPVVQSPNGPHPVQMPPQAMVLMTHPPPTNVMMPPKVWQNTQPTVFLHPNSPQHPAYWLPHLNSGFQMDDGMNKIDFRSEPDADQLVLKRKEILSRLVPFTTTDDEDAGDDSVGHVSYTVASSVLDERLELHNHPMVVIGRPPIELPPLPTAVMSPNPNDENMYCFSMVRTPDLVAVQARNRATSVPFLPSGPCPETLVSPDGMSVATVQADCGAMQICDTICQPLPTAGIQPTQVSAVTFIPTMGGEHVAVMQPAQPTLMDAQGVVSNSLDKIIDVKERMNEVDSATMSSAVSQQLRVELRIAEREMDLLDPRTQASCLLRELRQVDLELERIEACRPME